MEPILQIQHVSIDFTQYTGRKGLKKQRLQVIRDLSLTICPGQVVAVVGASGSGKSLLAHGILHILPYNSHMEGEIFYDGVPLTETRAKQLRGQEIVLIPQGVTYLDPLMKVGPQIRKGRNDAAARAASREALARYGLAPETEELYPFELSGGMARRVLIATAVVEHPRLVIADEPTPGLDMTSARRILSHLREIADEGAGILLITHDLEQALAVADRVVVFYAGETIEEAAVTDFSELSKLRHPFTKALWRAMPQHGFQPISGAQPYPGTVEKGCPFVDSCVDCVDKCRLVENIPLREVRGGWVRCLQAERPSRRESTTPGEEVLP